MATRTALTLGSEPSLLIVGAWVVSLPGECIVPTALCDSSGRKHAQNGCKKGSRTGQSFTGLSPGLGPVGVLW